MNNRHLFPLFACAVAFLLPSLAHAEEDTPTAKGFSFVLKKGMPPMYAALVWENSSLQAIEIRANSDGPVAQRIKVGETETIGCDLDEQNLPPGKWIGTVDYNHDGFRDIFLQIAQGSEIPYAVLLYDAKAKRFVASKSLAAVTGLRLDAANAAEPKKSARKLEESFGLVTKSPNEPPKLSISGPKLQKGDALHVVSYDERQTAYDAEILEPVESSGEEGMSSYTLDFITSYDSRLPDDQVFLGTAVIGAADGITKGKGPATTRLANSPAGQRLYFRNCTSIEGMHFTVWSGKPLQGKRVWHAYHALDYDVEANCTPKDYAEERKD